MWNFDDPFYRPLWIRLLVCGSCFGWGLFEFSMGSTGWAVAFLAIGAFTTYRLFVTFDPDKPDKKPDKKKDSDD